MITRGEFAALMLLNRSKLRGLRLSRPPPPAPQARRYARALKAMLADAWALTQKHLMPVGQKATDQASRVAATVRQDADSIGDAIDQIESDFWAKWTRKRISKMVEPVAQEVTRFQANGLNKQLAPAVGVDVVGGESWLASAVDEFTAENVALIKTIPQTYFDQIESLTKREIADGSRWEQITPQIQERFRVSESRAKLIARDQTGKFYGDLNRVRQKDLGIDKFIWRTVQDNRVRDEHESRNGETFLWSQPPQGETPGEPVNCRCYADPVLSNAEAET